MAKYSKGAQKSVATAMKRMEKGKLESGKSGKKVTDPKQAIAIGLSEAKKKGAKVPAKKTAVKKSAPARTVKKAAKAAPAKKSAPSKGVKKQAKVSPAKKTVPKNAPGKKSAAKKNSLAKKASPAGQSKSPGAKPIPQRKQAPVKKATQSRDNIPPPPEDTVVLAQEAVNADLPPVEEKSPTIAVKAEDPLLAQDKHEMIKATSKSDPKSKVRLSSAKTGVKPSGKKPLWN